MGMKSPKHKSNRFVVEKQPFSTGDGSGRAVVLRSWVGGVCAAVFTSGSAAKNQAAASSLCRQLNAVLSTVKYYN